ncbi:LacI family DNA-binding transcriptional regulator [Paenibacillus sp. GYB004]|uniref:LacI family DNA-binding transcriptional regulator n=1 Tax=Paenibacillus sp. GYB004 TaxID=2994393 RepID=UPI002F96D801
MPRRKSVTLQTLASELGLSIHTVSKALRGMPGMSEETRHEVLSAARRLGYRTKDQEHSLAVEHIPLFPNRKRRFKLMFTGNSVYSRLNQILLEGLQDKLAEYGHTIDMLMIPSSFDKGESFDNWADQNSLMYSDGIFIPPMTDPIKEELLLKLPLPRILFNFPPPAAEVDSVIWDVGTAVRLSVRHLIANGHRSILYIGNIHNQRGFRLRWQSFVDSMQEAGLDANPELHITKAISEKEAWVASVQDCLVSLRATAILNGVHNNLAWIYHACSTLGKRIPEDYSLISLQHERDEFLPQLSRPSLAIRETGVRGAERMLWRLANPNLPYEHIMLQGTFFEGDTVKPLKA